MLTARLESGVPKAQAATQASALTDLTALLGPSSLMSLGAQQARHPPAPLVLLTRQPVQTALSARGVVKESKRQLYAAMLATSALLEPLSDPTVIQDPTLLTQQQLHLPHQQHAMLAWLEVSALALVG